ncbi:hypothetical protein HCB27_07605 [Listeria booriae]|uniref:Uncharacterized protein n=1 Tax=Listeria booriae TaxID=1552123 RepID=A0A7X0Z5Q7_9LIST|nr:hypothetical protein [Listeria booriae]MBC2176476.1 hypothetical protein [Listeria booriae]MDT0111083.1 hypothetical protein [Listeria booriae]
MPEENFKAKQQVKQKGSKQKNKQSKEDGTVLAYLDVIGRREKFFDIVVPIVGVSILNIVFLYILKNIEYLDLLNFVFKSTASVVNIMAILSGFNTASLSILSTVRKANFDSYKAETIGVEFRKILKYFQFSISIQLILLLLGIMLSFSQGYIIVLFDGLISNCYIKLIILVCSTIWFSSIISSILISIRSIPVLSKLIELIFNAK